MDKDLNIRLGKIASKTQDIYNQLESLVAPFDVIPACTIQILSVQEFL